MKYFTYGSNMDPDDLRKWCNDRHYSEIESISITPAVLKGWKLDFNYYSKGRKGGAANIMENSSDEVWGLLMEVNKGDYDKISEKEGAPDYYSEITITVFAEDKPINDVKTFKVVKSREKNEYQLPTESYLRLLKNAAKKYNFPTNYLEMLENLKTKP